MVSQLHVFCHGHSKQNSPSLFKLNKDKIGVMNSKLKAGWKGWSTCLYLTWKEITLLMGPVTTHLVQVTSWDWDRAPSWLTSSRPPPWPTLTRNIPGSRCNGRADGRSTNQRPNKASPQTADLPWVCRASRSELHTLLAPSWPKSFILPTSIEGARVHDSAGESVNFHLQTRSILC